MNFNSLEYLVFLIGVFALYAVVLRREAARDLLLRHLSSDGCRVVTAAAARQGLDLAREILPDLITLDVQMPDMDGWEALAELKADARLADIPVILVTILEDRNLGYALGAAEYVTKPVSRERIRELLGRYGARSAPVLIVEDDASTRELVRRTLEQEGVATIEAENGRIALGRLASCRPSLILLDLMLPDGAKWVISCGAHTILVLQPPLPSTV